MTSKVNSSLAATHATSCWHPRRQQQQQQWSYAGDHQHHSTAAAVHDAQWIHGAILSLQTSCSNLYCSKI